MYLKSIEIHGFKSFANKIRLEFHNGITGIVGPNGSGKSNVADAVRWVLGEQRVRQLRGGSMQDVIFSGTELRKPLGYAFVAITLDNSDHALPIEYDEVTVSRRLYRSGESEYMINGNSCRLKDVNELFMDTGIGKEGYSIIGQGQIDQILSSKPEDRRNLFDEAAGIVKFKMRKETAIRKLEDGKTNLTRISDILAELEKQTGPLEKQAEVAKIFLKNRDEVKTLDINLFLLDNAEKRAELVKNEEELGIASNDLDRTRKDYEDAKIRYESLSAELEGTDRQIEETRNRITDSSVKREKLTGQIGILEEQIRSARENVSHFESRIADEEEKLRARENEMEALQADKKTRDDRKAEAETRLSELRKELEDVSGSVQEMEQEIESCKSRLIQTLNNRAAIRSRLSSLNTMEEQTEIRKAELTGRLLRAHSEESTQEETLDALKQRFSAITEEIKSLNNEQKSSESELSGMREKLSESDRLLRESQSLFLQEKSKLETLSNLTERYEGYGNSIRRVMEKKANTPGIIGVVADIIKTEKKYETAIEVALGGNIQNIVTDDEDTAKRMIAFLKETKAGRATFLPLTSIDHPQEFRNREILSEKGVIGLAEDLVETESRYRAVAKSLLGRIVAVDTVDNAVVLARKYNYSVRMVTLEGELLTPGGAISGGAYKNSTNLLSRRREMQELEKKVKDYEKAAKDAAQAIEDTKARRNELRSRIEEIRLKLQEKFLEQNTARINVEAEEDRQRKHQETLADLKNESDAVEEKLKDIRGDKSRQEQLLEESVQAENNDTEKAEELRTKLEEVKKTEEENVRRVNEAELGLQRVTQDARFVQENVNRLSQEIREQKLSYDELIKSRDESKETITVKEHDLEEVRLTIETSVDVSEEAGKELELLRSKKEELTGEQKTCYNRSQELGGTLSGLEREIARLTSKKERSQEAIETRINYMWDEYEITLTDAAAMRDESMTDVSAMKSRINTLKEEIKKLGDVNVGAIEEYRALMERYEFLRTQHDDLVKAQDELKEIIEQLDESMRKQFLEQFELIKTEFDKVFQEMFGGGRGTLELIEDEDVLEAGIRVGAQPPGKRLVNMMQLSGGEKALTAIALLFAIQNLKPSPFCLLDEIEAALDENNVTRFAGYLHKLDSTQFIVITHRRGTMDSADRLYGITMQEKGVSALVSVNLIDKDLE